LVTGIVAAQAAAAGPLDFAKVRGSAEARQVVDWVLRHADHGTRPFAVVDKRGARLYVFAADGTLMGHTAALLGATPGDHTVPGVGARAQTGEVGVDERTTPAGRFEAAPGRNLEGEHVVWADYASAFAIHRVRPGKSWKAREARLATPSPADNRVSYGCVVVPVAFYEGVVEPVLGSVRSVVYVLPETRGWQELFGLAAQQ
jgi:hypothetical protein